ncbi:MAG: type I restriction enzyme HsdR N-terminal domain-containing protein [Chitinophagales bacterium]
MQITLGKYEFRIREQDQQRHIFDIIRKRFVTLTPEEWIRQHWLHYLIDVKKYPRSLIAVEMNITLNQLSKRCDVVVYNRHGNPFLIIECKSSDVKISQKVFDQIARYNLKLQVKYLVVSNGADHHCCAIDFENNTFQYLDSLPELK